MTLVSRNRTVTIKAKKNDILRENVQPEENSDSIEVIFDSSVHKATGNDASSQMIIDVSSASRENILAEYFEGALDLNFQKENGNNSSQIVDASRENVLPGEEPAFDEYTNDGTACSTDSSSTVIEAALSPLGQLNLYFSGTLRNQTVRHMRPL